MTSTRVGWPLLLAWSLAACGGGATVQPDGPPAAPCLLAYSSPSSEQPPPEQQSPATEAAPSDEQPVQGPEPHSHGDVPDHDHTAPAPRGALPASDRRGRVVKHGALTPHAHQGNELVGIATRSLGAQEHEVWRSRVAPGSQTPLHTHESEEIFVFLKGKGRARIGEETLEFAAPATVIAPAGLPHQFFNTGDEPTEAIVIVRVGSRIDDATGAPMDLPWRRRVPAARTNPAVRTKKVRPGRKPRPNKKCPPTHPSQLITAESLWKSFLGRYDRASPSVNTAVRPHGSCGIQRTRTCIPPEQARDSCSCSSMNSLCVSPSNG